MKQIMKYRTKILSVSAGALLGFAYYYFIGCNSGTCPITSDPTISTLYGAAIGFVFSISTKKDSDDDK